MRAAASTQPPQQPNAAVRAIEQLVERETARVLKEANMTLREQPDAAPPEAEHGWRVGRTVGRTLYFRGNLVGVMDTPELAARVIVALQRLQPDAPASPAVTAWRALSDEAREEVIDWIRDAADEDDNMLSEDGLDKEDRIAAHRFVVASNAALDLLRSLAPEAGDADGGR